jgi:hypothetical protein
MKLHSPSSDFDPKLVALVDGYVVGIYLNDAPEDEINVFVTGSGSDSFGFVTLEGFVVDEEHDYIPHDESEDFSARVDDIETLEVF